MLKFKNRMDPLVSIITINYNQLAQTIEFVKLIKMNSYKNIEIIVVDNASEERPDKLERNFPDISVIRSNTNLGFAGGNNLGIKASNGEFLFFVNNDVYIDNGAIESLLNRLHTNPEAGMASPKIKFYSHPEIIQYAGFNKINKWTGRNSAIGNKQKDNGQFNQPCETYYAHGAAMMVKREAIEKAGLMPEIFFLYYEEVDWCNRIKEQGYKIFYEPRAVVYHKESLSIGKGSVLKTYYLNRNRILFMRRNINGLNFFLFTIFTLLFSIPKNTLKYLIYNKVDHLKAYISAIIWNLKNLKSIS